MKRVLVAMTTAAALLLGGCASDDDPGTTPAPTTGGDTFPITVGDLTLEKRPERIVSLGPSPTEVLFAIGAGSQVVAVDDLSNFPPEAPKSELSAFKPNAEAIAQQNPDLVVLTGNPDKIVEQLATLKIPTFLTPAATTLDESYAQVRQLGQLTGNTAEATVVADRMRTDIDKIIQDVPKRDTPLTYYWELDQSFYSVTSKTFVGSILGRMGLENVADAADADGSKGGYPQLSQEVLVQADPDLIFLADTKCCGQSAATVKEREGWGTIAAVKSGQIVELDDDIASRWGPRIVDLVRATADAVAKVPA